VRVDKPPEPQLASGTCQYHDKNSGHKGGVPEKRRTNAFLLITTPQKIAESERTKKNLD
jgi:hypothetical protein